MCLFWHFEEFSGMDDFKLTIFPSRGVAMCYFLRNIDEFCYSFEKYFYLKSHSRVNTK